ncbi:MULTISPECIES: helix-turn-helix domain-containing protein [Deinococcus]|uniref:Helix-turn-helix domain-containing protein n=1 Tax=Deinococcus rufus TaxID=2136097 RepID=A0ABV7Z8X8_9DEIO|nr:helix-turn-helix domain-containing protein [Deinococcus sp. AB2017081]WQE97446.1 helix-turn-helix domain-containing protein [Deinococcus sp. AB2017081]
MSPPPPGVPSLLKVGQVARALNLSERQIKGWIERGTLAYVQPTGRCGGRLVPASALAVLIDRHGLPVDWSKVL